MKRSCPFEYLPPVHPQLRGVMEYAPAKRKQGFEDSFEEPSAKRFCAPALSLKRNSERKSEAEGQNAKRMRLEEAESRTNMLVGAYRRIENLEQIIRQLGIELEYYRQKTSCATYNSQIIAY